MAFKSFFVLLLSLQIALLVKGSPTVLVSRSVADDLLNEHNSYRAEHGAAPLKWNTTLANAAQTWANKCQFQHSGGTVGPYGENLYASGSSGGPPANPVNGVTDWENESSEYDPNNPQPSHFTQVAWKSTTELGCAVVECGDKIFGPDFPQSTYLVCEYNPAGNVVGQFPQNVQK